jgi:putative endonuclease
MQGRVPHQKMHYVYIIKSRKDGKYYIGQTVDLRKRFEEHNAGKNPSTKHRGPFEMTYYEAFSLKSAAFKRERNLKKFKKTYSELIKRIEDIK